jgi:hypothetical protein
MWLSRKTMARPQNCLSARLRLDFIREEGERKGRASDDEGQGKGAERGERGRATGGLLQARYWHQQHTDIFVQRRITALKEKRAAKEEKERYEKMAEKMHKKRVERLKRKEKRNKLINS